MDDVQLIHMNGRAYDYNLGRFLSVDPLVHKPGNSQGINPYSYIFNNPLSGIDPTGYEPQADSGNDTCPEGNCNTTSSSQQVTTSSGHQNKQQGSTNSAKPGTDNHGGIQGYNPNCGFGPKECFYASNAVGRVSDAVSEAVGIAAEQKSEELAQQIVTSNSTTEKIVKSVALTGTVMLTRENQGTTGLITGIGGIAKSIATGIPKLIKLLMKKNVDDVAENADNVSENAVNISTAGKTTEEAEAIKEYAQRSNEWLAKNGPQKIKSTAGKLRKDASAAARKERLRAARDGEEYQGQAGHVPDTAVSGQADPPAGWLDMPGCSNNSCGGVLGSRVGKTIDHYTVDGVKP